jgi:oligoendopeptidase F
MSTTTKKRAKKPKQKTLPPRNKVKQADTWDLGSLYSSDAAWEKDFTRWEKQIKSYAKFQGTLSKSAAQLAACLKFDCKFDRLAERLGTYAFLKTTEDTAASEYQRMIGRYQHAASEASQAASFMRPEILAIPASKFKKLLTAKELQPYQLLLDRERTGRDD